MNVTRSHFCPTLYKTCSSKVNVPVPLSPSHRSGGVCDGHNQESCTEGSQLERGARWDDWPKQRRVRKFSPSSGPCGQVGSERPHVPNGGRGGSHPWGWVVCGEQVLWLGLLKRAGGSRGPALLQKWVGSDRQGLPGWVLHMLDFQERAAEGPWACWVNLKSAGMSTTAA